MTQASRTTELAWSLRNTPGRCRSCGSHPPTQGHVAGCPTGPNASFTDDGTTIRQNSIRGDKRPSEMQQRIVAGDLTEPEEIF